MAERDLGSYRRKRDFASSPEPSGDGGSGGAPRARFVIQEHSATRLHWDLRLEHEGVLASWALPRGVPPGPRDNRIAIRTEDHPLEYLDFHGEIPAGNYGAGTMTIWDAGRYELLTWEDRKVEVALHGERLQGRYALFAIGTGEGVVKDWMIHRMDPPDDAEAEPMPEQLVPMLARSGALPREDGGWAYEIKWDGVRAVCFSEPGRMRLVTRNGNDVTSRYPELSRMNRALSMHAAVLDGEVVAFEPGSSPPRPSFAALQGRMHLAKDAQIRRLAREAPVTYVAFDLLWLDGHPLTRLPYEERRARLLELGLQGARWQTPEHVVGEGAALLAVTREHGLEGVMAKRLDSVYEPGRRTGAWIKVKNTNRQELVIGGWVPGDGRRRGRIGALLVGVRDEEAGDPARPLRFAGRVGTGFTEGELDRLAALLAPLEQEASPFAEPGPRQARPPREAVFAAPRLVCEVQFTEWTRDGVLRAPAYKGLRDDKPAELVVREELPRGAVRAEIGGRELRLTNLGKPLWRSGATKRDLITYYVRIAPVLLAHLEGRPLTLKRYPDGADGQHFYEKHAPSHRPAWVATTEQPSERGAKAIRYVMAEDVATLAWLGNLADLELHTPMHRAREPGRPTMLAFDLDPGEPAGLLECLQVAVVLQGTFERLGLRAFPKTSGAKGLQIYVPLNVPGVGYEETKRVARAVAELLEAEAGDLAVARQTKRLRRGRVLVDWSQNDPHKTTVCVYSPRARDRPTVSTPLTWDEVREALGAGDASALVHDLDGVLARVEEHGDLFADVLALVQELPRL